METASASTAAALEASSASSPPLAPGLRGGLRVGNQWVARNAPAVQSLAADAPVLSPGGQHATQRVEAHVLTPSGQHTNVQAAEVKHSVKPPGESDSAAKRREERGVKREKDAIRRFDPDAAA